jgi:hypothetical protein
MSNKIKIAAALVALFVGIVAYKVRFDAKQEKAKAKNKSN